MRARDNPFATDRVLRLRYRLPSWPALLDRLEALRYRAAIVGPEGTGKTTLLEDLAPQLEERGYSSIRLFLNRDVERAARCAADRLRGQIDPLTIVLLDGAEQLNAWQWCRVRRITRRSAGLIITSHEPGMLPTLIECSTSPELLDALMNELIGEGANAYTQRGRELFRMYGGNLREVLRAFYDDAANA